MQFNTAHALEELLPTLVRIGEVTPDPRHVVDDPGRNRELRGCGTTQFSYFTVAVGRRSCPGAVAPERSPTFLFHQSTQPCEQKEMTKSANAKMRPKSKIARIFHLNASLHRKLPNLGGRLRWSARSGHYNLASIQQKC